MASDSFCPGKKLYERVKWCLTDRLNLKFDLLFTWEPNRKYSMIDTVKTLYNVTRYNRIFNIRHKVAGNASVSIIVPSL